MKHLLHFNKLWIIYHLMSIQTIDVIGIQRCLLWFLIRLGCSCSYHYSLLFLISTHLYMVIHHSTICAIFFSFPYIILCFWWCYLFCTLWYWQCIPCFGSIHPFFTQHHCLFMLLKFQPLHPCSHNFCRPVLNIIIRKLSMVGICKPWTNFWIHS
jgi:hypothetical protein